MEEIRKLFTVTLYYVETGLTTDVVLTRQSGLLENELCHIEDLVQKIGSHELTASIKTGTGAMFLRLDSPIIDGMVINISPNPGYKCTKSKRI